MQLRNLKYKLTKYVVFNHVLKFELKLPNLIKKVTYIISKQKIHYFNKAFFNR